jgi:L-seryl-tRNA(Ser) seleniumtransferase
VLAAVGRTLAGYCNLEFDVNTGARGRRAAHLERKINVLAGSEASLVVNNNAAALMLAINTFARGRDVVVSRGELVEIGGSFRLPEIIERAGGVLREVGTTNKTRLSDYHRAAGKNTGLMLKVHTSNFRIEGFTEEVSVADLSRLARQRRVPFLHDAGSGLFVDPAAWGFEHEPVPGQSLRAGADLVSMSGDKLIGGPQAGIVAGRKRLINAMKKNPMMRALRPGKITVVALDAALAPFLNPNRIDRAPLFSQLSAGPKKLKARAARLAKSLMKANPVLEARVEAANASIGGGSQPGRRIPSFAVTLSSRHVSPQQIAAVFRRWPVPVIGAFQQGRFALNVITLLPGQDRVILDAARALGAPS